MQPDGHNSTFYALSTVRHSERSLQAATFVCFLYLHGTFILARSKGGLTQAEIRGLSRMTALWQKTNSPRAEKMQSLSVCLSYSFLSMKMTYQTSLIPSALPGLGLC